MQFLVQYEIFLWLESAFASGKNGEGHHERIISNFGFKTI